MSQKRGSILLWLLGWQCVLSGLMLYALGLVSLFYTLKKTPEFSLTILLLTVGAIAIHLADSDSSSVHSGGNQ